MKAVIILKCEGHQLNGFKFCSGVENIILDLEKTENTANYTKMITYLNNIAKVFDGPCTTMNIISNALFKIYEYGYTDDKMYKSFSHFWSMHKHCGLILAAKIKE